MEVNLNQMLQLIGSKEVELAMTREALQAAEKRIKELEAAGKPKV